MPADPQQPEPGPPDLRNYNAWNVPPASADSTAAAYDWSDDHRDPRLPTPEQLAELHPAQDLFVALLDIASERALGKPLRPRFKVSPAGLLRGEVDLVKIELPAYAVAGLMVDRFIVHAEHVRVRPGFPATLVAEPVHFTAVVSQANVDRWTRDRRLPFRLSLTDQGVVTTTGIAGIRVSEVVTTLEVAGGFIKLQPKRASLLGMPAPLARFFRSYLPLPPLPREAQLDSVQPSDGELAVRFRIDRFEQDLTPDIAARVSSVFNLPLPGLR